MNPISNSLEGRICLVTGATSGIGKETALGLARLGAHLVIVGRGQARISEAAQSIRALSANQEVEPLEADLFSQAEIRRAAREFARSHARLDVLVNNAGGIFPDLRRTGDGYERTWALNHLAYVLLTLELLGPLREAGGARIVNVASTAHARGGLDFDNLQGERRYTPMSAYARSKLANVLFTYALARRLRPSGITANCLHPGIVATGFGRNTKGLFRLGLAMARPFFLSEEKGARTSIFLASSPAVAGISGEYFSNCRAERSSAPSYDDAVQERLWRLSLQQTGEEAVLP
jgi:retinol dehydrogenase 12